MIRNRRLVTFLLGAWLGASALMIWVATRNQRTVNQILAAPPHAAAAFLESLGKDRMSVFMRYQAAETNRALFTGWGMAQSALAIGVFLMILFGTTAGRTSVILSGAMVVLTLVMTLYLIPQMSAYGRASDFLFMNRPAPERGRFAMLHAAYSSLECVKILLGLILTGLFLVDYPRRKRSSGEVHPVNYADHRRINR